MLCTVCEGASVRRKGRNIDGTPRYANMCSNCYQKRWGSSAARTIKDKFKKKACERCGFEGHPVQMDVDHMDGDSSNNDPANLQTLCANCHRLKTYQENESVNTKYR